MTTTTMTFILGEDTEAPDFSGLGPKRLATRQDVENELARLSAKQVALWIAHLEEMDWLLGAFSRLTKGKRRRDQLIVLDPVQQAERLNLAHALFWRVVPGFNLLPANEIAEVLRLDNRGDYCIGGVVDRETETVTLFRGDLSTLVVPWGFFETSGTGLRPDFGAFEVRDWGQSIGLGEYEASMDAVLYELDADYRRRIKAERLEQDQSFGASLRRLRKQKKLRRSEFGPSLAKAVARIERGEVDSPRRKTLRKIAQKLEVEVKELGEY